MHRKTLLLFSVVAALFVVAWAFQAEAPVSTASSSTVVDNAGYRVHIDPSTGHYTTPEAGFPVDLGKEVENALRTDSKGLVEEPSTTAGGGMMVRLDGRFQSSSMANVDEDGNLSAPCLTGLPIEHNSNTNDQ